MVRLELFSAGQAFSRSGPRGLPNFEVGEKELRDSLDPEVAKVLQGKRLLLLERIAQSIGWTDTNVFAELRQGFDLIGHHKHSGSLCL